MTVNAETLRSGKSHRDENFPVASRLVAEKHRAPIMAFYNFVRTADDIADSPTLAPADKHVWLDRLEASLDGTAEEPVGTQLRAALDARQLSDRHARDLLSAFRLDVEKSRYDSFDDLMAYCALSAMPVGRFVLDVHGEARSTWPASDAVCAALQIVNHLQDCGKDWKALQRCYLPLVLVRSFDARLEDLAGTRATPELLSVIRSLALSCRGLLDPGFDLTAQIRDTRLACEIEVVVALSRNIVDLLMRGDPLVGGVHLGKARAGVVALGATSRQITRRLLRAPFTPSSRAKHP